MSDCDFVLNMCGLRRNEEIGPMPHGRTAVLSLLVLVFGFPSTGSAQTIDATFQGRALDPSESVIAGAQITLTNLDTGWARVVETATNGTFQFTLVPPGPYLLA